ncbi:MAG: TolC family protein [Bacillota bacterium]
MRKKLVAILMMLFVLGCISTGYAAEEEVSTENTITLEKAKSLVNANSRNLKKYKISVDKAEYQLYQAEDQRDEIFHSLNSMYSKYDKLWQEYTSLQENQGDPAVADRINELEAEISNLEQEMIVQNEKIDSSSDGVEDAENNYNDSIKEEQNYRKQLEYVVEELYTTILNQEESLFTLKKECELKKYLLDMERKKLQLGKSTQLKVSQLEADIINQNNAITELTNNIKTKKWQLNDMMGKGYDDELNLVPFEVPGTVEIPEYNQLLSDAMQTYDALLQIKRDIKESEDELDDEDDYYQSQLLKSGIKEKELQLEDEIINLSEAIINLITDVKSKQEGHQLALINLKNAQKSYEWDKKRYETGLISKLALLESELNYLNMKNKEASSGYALYLAQRSLKLAEDGILI